MVDFEITRKTKLKEINNDMCHNYYYLIQGRMYNDKKEKATKYKKFKWVEFFDIIDLQEYFEKDYITEQDIKDYLNDRECIDLTLINDYNDTKHINDFYKYCNDTINDYNDTNKGGFYGLF